MNRKVIKIAAILLMIVMVVMTLSTSVFATDSTWDNVNPDMFKGAKDSSGATESATNIVGAIISIVQVIGMGVAIIMLIVMAIKYISAAPSEKAELKKGITIYVVGAIVLFAASGILQIIKNFASSNIKATETKTAYVQMVDIDMNDIDLG